MGEAESAARSLTALAQTSSGSDPAGFRREVEDLCRQWATRPRFDQYSLGRLILESVSRAARHRLYFPVEMVLMVKAIVTFEAVGHILMPDLDVAGLSRRYVTQILLERLDPLHLVRQGLTELPELADALAKTPRLITEGLLLVEQATHRPAVENPFAGMRATLYGGFCLVAGAILAGFGVPWPLWVFLLLIGLLLPLRRH